jgi:DNA mismatch repair ATPase MutS
MQIHDNLEQKISTFYAELKRIKMIVDVAMTRKPVIFLLDEIFKGTNSNDRIFAAKTLIKRLTTMSTIGLVTTHDLELGTLERENPLFIKNYHFTDRIIENQIQFDYKIKHGISKNTNAIALMKLIGIDITEEKD